MPLVDCYDEVAQVYIRLVEADSAKASASLRKLHFTAGAHAAFRAALIIATWKLEVRQNRFLPDLKNYAYLFQDYPETVWILEEAIAYCLPIWGISDVTVALDIGNPSRVISEPIGRFQS